MVLAAALGISSFLAGGATAAGFFENKLAAMQKELKDAQEEEKEQLHWDTQLSRETCIILFWLALVVVPWLLVPMFPVTAGGN